MDVLTCPVWHRRDLFEVLRLQIALGRLSQDVARERPECMRTQVCGQVIRGLVVDDEGVVIGRLDGIDPTHRLVESAWEATGPAKLVSEKHVLGSEGGAILPEDVLP